MKLIVGYPHQKIKLSLNKQLNKLSDALKRLAGENSAIVKNVVCSFLRKAIGFVAEHA